MQAPDFWHNTSRQAPDWRIRLLSPLSQGLRLWQRLRIWRARRTHPLPKPVWVVGNLVAGGAGKTPTVQALQSLFADQAVRPQVITRGYGGRMRGPGRITPQDDWQQTGDEPLLLAQGGTVWVAKDRKQGCLAAIEAGARLLLCDDGLQDPRIPYHTRLLVLDGHYGLGNGRLMPAGPLREPWADALSRTDALLVIGEDRHQYGRQAARAGVPVFHATLQPDLAIANWLRERPVVAFAGLGRPDKFRETLIDIGCHIRAWHPFPDHHPYQLQQLEALIQEAEASGSTLVTTTKDAVKLPPAIRSRITVVPVTLQLQEPALWQSWWRQRYAMALQEARHP